MFNLLKQLQTPKPESITVYSATMHHILEWSLNNAMHAKKEFEDMQASGRFDDSYELTAKIAHLEEQIQLLKSTAPLQEKIKFYDDSLISNYNSERRD